MYIIEVDLDVHYIHFKSYTDSETGQYLLEMEKDVWLW